MGNQQNLTAQVELINSREDFRLFLKSLSENLRLEPQRWENDQLGLFLDAMAAWVEDIEGYYENRGQTLPEGVHWKIFAQILLAAKYYE
jgi:hypothetical protein